MKLTSSPMHHLHPLQFKRSTSSSSLIYIQLQQLLLTLNILHTKIEIYNLQKGASSLYPLRVALHAQYQETEQTMTRITERLRAIAHINPRLKSNRIKLGQIHCPATWPAILSNLLETYETAASQIAVLAPLCHNAGDVMTLALLASIAESHGEAVSFYRSCMSSLQAENPSWNAAHS